MATTEEDLELGGETKEKKKGGIKPMLMLVGGGVLLVAASVGLSMFLLGGDKDEKGGKPAKTSVAGEKDPKKAALPPVYTPLDPPFVVNFEDEGAIRFLQISIEIVSRDPKVAEAVKLHMPAVRDQLIVLFSSANYATLSTRDGKEALRTEALATLKKILEGQRASTKVDGLYFTNFVMQ